MKSFIKTAGVFFFLLLFFSPLSLSKTQAQTTQEIPPVVIQSENSVEVGKNIIFRSDLSALPPAGNLKGFLWNFGDGKVGSQEEEAHVFSKPGKYNIKLDVNFSQGIDKPTITSRTEKEVFVYERSFFLLTEVGANDERIQILQKTAGDQNVDLSIFHISGSDRLSTVLQNGVESVLDNINRSDTILIWSDRAEAITLLNHFADRIDLSHQTIAVIAEGNMELLRNILNGVFSILHPERIIVTRREALDEFFTTPKNTDVLKVITARGYDFAVIDQQTVSQSSLFSLGSKLVQFLEKKGVDDTVLLLILYLPIIVSFVTFIRLVVGFSPAGSRVPIVLSYSFLILGWPVGVVVVGILSLVSYFFRYYFFESHLLYAAKVGVLTSILGIILFAIMGVMVAFNFTFFDYSSAIILVVLATIIDRVAGGSGERRFFDLLQIFFETIGVAFFGYLILSSSWLHIILLAHPEITLLFLGINILLGRFTGLRVVEYFRFKEILKHTEE